MIRYVAWSGIAFWALAMSVGVTHAFWDLLGPRLEPVIQRLRQRLQRLDGLPRKLKLQDPSERAIKLALPGRRDGWNHPRIAEHVRDP